jgi:hypothetical protein
MANEVRALYDLDGGHGAIRTIEAAQALSLLSAVPDQRPHRPPKGESQTGMIAFFELTPLKGLATIPAYLAKTLVRLERPNGTAS